MEWDVDFELTRLIRLLTERLTPGCIEQRFAAEDIEGLRKEINWEGDKIYVEVMKMMCRPHSDGHMRRYLEVHLSGTEYLRERLKELTGKAGEMCRQVFEVLECVLGQVQDCLSKWQQRYFREKFDPADWASKAEVMELLHIGESTFYRRKDASNWTTKYNGGVEYYLKSSLFE
jgi:hypothetical protein